MFALNQDQTDAFAAFMRGGVDPVCFARFTVKEGTLTVTKFKRRAAGVLQEIDTPLVFDRGDGGDATVWVGVAVVSKLAPVLAKDPARLIVAGDGLTVECPYAAGRRVTTYHFPPVDVSDCELLGKAEDDAKFLFAMPADQFRSALKFIKPCTRNFVGKNPPKVLECVDFAVEAGRPGVVTIRATNRGEVARLVEAAETCDESSFVVIPFNELSKIVTARTAGVVTVERVAGGARVTADGVSHDVPCRNDERCDWYAKLFTDADAFPADHLVHVPSKSVAKAFKVVKSELCALEFDADGVWLTSISSNCGGSARVPLAGAEGVPASCKAAMSFNVGRLKACVEAVKSSGKNFTVSFGPGRGSVKFASADGCRVMLAAQCHCKAEEGDAVHVGAPCMDAGVHVKSESVKSVVKDDTVKDDTVKKTPVKKTASKAETTPDPAPTMPAHVKEDTVKKTTEPAGRGPAAALVERVARVARRVSDRPAIAEDAAWSRLMEALDAVLEVAPGEAEQSGPVVVSPFSWAGLSAPVEPTPSVVEASPEPVSQEPGKPEPTPVKPAVKKATPSASKPKATPKAKKAAPKKATVEPEAATQGIREVPPVTNSKAVSYASIPDLMPAKDCPELQGLGWARPFRSAKGRKVAYVASGDGRCVIAYRSRYKRGSDPQMEAAIVNFVATLGFSA